MTKADPARLGESSAGTSRFLAGLKRWTDRTFARRELLLRSSDRVRCIRLSPGLQKATALSLALGFGWAVYSSVGFLEQRDELAARDLEIQRSQAAYGDLLAEVDRYQRHFASITQDLEETQRRMLAQLDSEALSKAPEDRAEQADKAAELRARMVVAQDELRSQLEALEADLSDVARRNGSLKDSIHSLQSALTATKIERDEVEAAHNRLGRLLSKTEVELAHERSEKSDLAARVVDLEAELDDWKSRHEALGLARAALAEERDLLASRLAGESREKLELTARLSALDDELADWKSRHAELAAARAALAEERDGLAEALEAERGTTASLSGEVAELEGTLAEARQRIDEVASARDALQAELAVSQDDLEQARVERDALAVRLDAEARGLRTAEARIEELESRRAELETGRAQLARALRDSKAHAGTLADRIVDLGNRLELSEAQIAALTDEREQRRRRVAALTGELEGARGRVTDLQGQLFGMTRTLDGADRKAEALAEQRDVLQARLVEARTALARQAEQHATVIQRLSDRTRQSIDTMEELLKLTGLDIEAVMTEASGRVEGDGKGGPFIPYSEVPESPHVDHPVVTLDALDDKIRRWEALQLVLASTPLSAPLSGDFRISSHFGKRKDPLNGRLSTHEGLDMVAAYRSPILATAPGVVTFAGWMSGYGRVIEIDHGFGIVTRFAHLRRIDVKKGQRVGFREQIGQLGNSGRSTGAHVHYEVLYNDKPLDPLKFMKAANHVLKG